MTKDQTIFNLLVAALQNISTANGYTFDVGSNVFEWRDSPLDPELNELPAIILRDEQNNPTTDDDTVRAMETEVVIIDSGDASPASMRAKRGDVLTAVSTVEGNPAVAGIQFAGSEMMIERQEYRGAACFLRFVIYYHAEIWTI